MRCSLLIAAALTLVLAPLGAAQTLVTDGDTALDNLTYDQIVELMELAGMEVPDVDDPHALRGLTTVHVEMGETTLPSGGSARGLARRIERSLRAGGLVTDDGEGAGRLELRISLMQIQRGYFIGPVTLVLGQDATLVRDLSIEAVAETWNQTVWLQSRDDDGELRALLRQAVDILSADFLTRHAEANPIVMPTDDPSLLRRLIRLLPFL